jgi:uncharacterized protein
MKSFATYLQVAAEASRALVPERLRARFKARHWTWWAGGRTAVARGAALGLFCGLLIPFGQIPASLLLAPLLRANIAAAAASTFVTNPFTMPFVYAAGYWLGGKLVAAHQAVSRVVDQEVVTEVSVESGAAGVVATTLLGLLLIASAIAALGYAVVWLAWPRVARLRRRRGPRRAPRPAPHPDN